VTTAVRVIEVLAIWLGGSAFIAIGVGKWFKRINERS
jgi:hypothetical protein